MVIIKYYLNEDELGKVKNQLMKTADFYNAEVAFLFFMTKKRAIKKLIPKPLKPSSIVMGSIFFANYPKTNFGCVYKEASLSLGVQHNGVEGSYCLTMPVTDEMALILGREVYGFPKKMADEIFIEMTDKDYRAKYVRKNVELINFSMEFEEEIDKEDFFKKISQLTPDKPVTNELEGISYNFKYMLSPSYNEYGAFDNKPRLVKQITTMKPVSKIKMGKNFNLKLQSSDCDFLGDIPVDMPIIGFYGVFNSSMHQGEIVAEIEKEDFIPYGYSKIDYLPE